MRLRSPAEFYIKGLIVDPNAYSTGDIRERLLDEGLDFISDAYIERLRSKLKPPDPFTPNDMLHAPSRNFLFKERINRLFQPDIPMKIARSILESPRAKEFVEATLMTGAPSAAVAQAITRGYNVYCSADALDVYKHYFWNIDLLDTTQMRLLTELRVEILAEHVPEFRDKKRILMRNLYYKNPRKIASEVPHSRTGALLTHLQMGIKPSRVDLLESLRETKEVAFLRGMEAVHSNDPMSSQKLLNFVQAGKTIDELLQQAVKPEEGLREQLRSVQLKVDTKPVPSIHQLSEGRHTVDVSPLKDHDDDSTPDDATGTGNRGGGAGTAG